VLVGIVAVDIVVVVFPVPRAGVVRWIDVDRVDSAFVSIEQNLQ
jgi:hypothetical protein